MTRVVRCDGSPGGGKTHTLKQKLRRGKEQGLTVDDFYWLNFTNSGRKDVEPELEDAFPEADDASDQALTIHGLALSLCIRGGVIDRDTLDDQIIRQGSFIDEDETDPFAKFCSARAIPYDPNAANPRKLLSGESDTDHTGNKLFAISDYLRQTYKEPEQWQAAPVDIRTPPHAVKRLLKEWDHYKRTAFDLRLFEDGDYVQEAIAQTLNPSVEVLLIDEFQDLAPLEYKLYKQWRDSSAVERVYIAGDPNQSIYSFRGGTPLYFEETPIDETITLKESYRCPAEIATVGREILDAHPQTDPKGFAGKDAGGLATWERIRDKTTLRDALITKTDEYDANPSVMLLARTKKHLGRLMRDLQTVGIPFEILGKRSSLWEGELGQMLTFLQHWDGTADGFARSNARKVLKHLPDGQTRQKQLGKGIGQILTPGAVAPAFEGYGEATEIVERLDVADWKRDALVNALDAPAAMSDSEVQVGTIHTAKGLEAPCVYLFADSSHGMRRRYTRNSDTAAEEHRCYYVGATRASDELHIVENYFSGPLAKPLESIKARGIVA